MRDVTGFINGTATPSTHEDFMALMSEAIRNMEIINSHLRRILASASRGSDTKGG